MIKQWRMTTALILACCVVTNGRAQETVPAAQAQQASTHLLKVIRTRPFYALDWRELRLVATDEQVASQLKQALEKSGRSAADVEEQSLWIDAAAGHPEAVLAFYDSNIIKKPEDKTLPNAACWARAAYGLDIENALAVCDAALAADRKGYTLVFHGMVELQLGRPADALRDFNEALGDKTFQSHPMLVDAAFGRGVARVRLGDSDGRKDIQVAIKANDRVATSFADAGIVP